ncbi:MAG TPA: VWA domain-containing protein [Verrucomicrobiae bacterium]|nr:VWA domain-containing protein [Verrucomicrobiae bacterium]
MRFEYLPILWLLLVVPPVLAVFFWWGERVKQKLLTQFVDARLLASLTVGISPGRRKLRYILVIAAVALLIVTMARWQWGFDLQEVEQRGLDVVVAVDTSKSMLATDITPNRLQRAKLAALELMQTSKADRLGLVAFAGDAFLSCPLTIDDAAFQQSVQALDVNSIPQGGTALAAAINTALDAFKEKSHYKALVLFTDGEDNDEGALEAAEKAAKAGLKIFTIGIGSTEGTLVTIPTADGSSDYIRDEKGQVLKTKLNEQLLQQIATATGGFYLPLRGGNTIATLYERGLAPMPKSEGVEKLIKTYHEQFKWPLIVAILLLLAEFFLPERVRQTAARGAAIGLVLVLSGANSQASPASAMHDYNTGHYTNALDEFTRLALVQTNDLRLVFNAADAAYRATNFDAAQKLFEKVTLSEDLKLQQRAFYNLGNTQFQLAQQAKDLDGLEQGVAVAAKIYERAVDLDKNDADAAFNLAFAKNMVEQIKLFKEAIRNAKSNADSAVRQRNYHRAVEIMEPLTKNPVIAKQFEDYTKKLKDIDAIATPHQP